MEIIFASTGVECVAAPSRGVIYLDPTLDQESAVEAIQASMPRVHIDAIRHWVDKAMPSATPLSRRGGAPEAKRRARWLTAFACIGLLVIGALAMSTGLWVKRSVVDNVFARPVFGELARDRGWDCDRSVTRPQHATCLTKDGVTIHAIAATGDAVTSYTMVYERAGVEYLDRLVAWETPGDRPVLLGHAQLVADGLHPNLFDGPTWMLYGNDAERIPLWADELVEPDGP